MQCFSHVVHLRHWTRALLEASHEIQLIAPTALRMKRAARKTLLGAVTELVHAVSAKHKSLIRRFASICTPHTVGGTVRKESLCRSNGSPRTALVPFVG